MSKVTHPGPMPLPPANQGYSAVAKFRRDLERWALQANHYILRQDEQIGELTTNRNILIQQLTRLQRDNAILAEGIRHRLGLSKERGALEKAFDLVLKDGESE